jgi:hypothetical protein
MSVSEHVEGGSAYAPLSEVAAAYGVSVDTIRRRLRRGEIEGRRETTPQGFRWLAQLPTASGAAPHASTVARHEGEYVAQGELIATLQRELELRNQEVARLHTVVERQALALERAAAALPAQASSRPGSGVAGASATPDPASASFWQRLRRLLRG